MLPAARCPLGGGSIPFRIPSQGTGPVALSLQRHQAIIRQPPHTASVVQRATESRPSVSGGPRRPNLDPAAPLARCATGLLPLGCKVFHERAHALHSDFTFAIQQVMPWVCRANEARYGTPRLPSCGNGMKRDSAHRTDHAQASLVLSKRFGSRQGTSIDGVMHHWGISKTVICARGQQRASVSIRRD